MGAARAEWRWAASTPGQRLSALDTELEPQLACWLTLLVSNSHQHTLRQELKSLPSRKPEPESQEIENEVKDVLQPNLPQDVCQEVGPAQHLHAPHFPATKAN